MVFPLEGRWHKCVVVAEDFGFSLMKMPRTPLTAIHDALDNMLIRALVSGVLSAEIEARASFA